MSLDPWRGAPRRVLIGVSLLAAFLAAASASAQTRQSPSTANVFEVRDVAVDVTAKTAAAAREKALADGEQQALRRLLQRLVLRVHYGSLPQLDEQEIAALVKDFEVAEEKSSPVRYLARLNYRFKAAAVRRLLIDLSLPFAETPSKPVLVLPVYQSAGALLLFDDPNPWRDAWTAYRNPDSLVPLVFAKGDLRDIATIGAEQAVDGDPSRLGAIAARYGAGDTLVAYGIFRLDSRGRPVLEVYLSRYGTELQEQTVVRTFAVGEGESTDDLLKRAAAQLARQVEETWKRDNLLQFGEPGVIAVRVPIRGLADWLAVKSRLAGVAVIRRADIVLMSRDEVRVNLHHIGTTDQLILALKQADLILESEGNSWSLGLAHPVGAKGS